MTPRIVDTVVIHCSATPPEMDIGADEIRRWHVEERGWDDIGYHVVIRRDGGVEGGRSPRLAGTHVRGHNQRSIGVCLVGGSRDDGAPDTPHPYFTPAQWRTLLIVPRIVETWARNGAIDLAPDWRILGHRDLDPKKACPCFDAGSFFAGLAPRAA